MCGSSSGLLSKIVPQLFVLTTTSFFLIIWILRTGSAFVVVTNHNQVEGWILFDAQIKISTNNNPHQHQTSSLSSSRERNFGTSGGGVEQVEQEIKTNFNFYTYRISHHKTQPWIHRLVHLDKQGKLRLKKYFHEKLADFSNDPCGRSQFSPLIPNLFLVYIDIIAQPFQIKNNASSYHNCLQYNLNLNEDQSESFKEEQQVCTYFDYISFPLTIITQPLSSRNHPDCHFQKLFKFQSSSSSSQPQKQNQQEEEDTIDKNQHELEQEPQNHLVRSVDDIYVSFPIEGHFCHHASEKLGNIYNFLPASVRSECQTTAKVVSNTHFFAIESSTGDIVLRADWCLFESLQTVEILLNLQCSVLGQSSSMSKSDMDDGKGKDKAIMSWDQLVHFIIHRFDGSSISGVSSGTSGGNSVMDFHPIHRMRREMRNLNPFFEQTMYIASVPEEQPPGITVTTISATDPENSPLIYSMTSLLDARSQQFFTLDSKSGIISTVDKLDREKMDVHYFRIVATDSGIPPRTGTATLQVNVQDINDGAPEFEQTAYSVSIREGIPVGSTVLSVRATDFDADKNGQISYTILNPHDTDDAFRIESDSGVITTKLPLDREQRDEYTLIVQAQDMSPVQIDRKSSTATVRIEVTDVNDHHPNWVNPQSYNVTVPENSDASNYPIIATVSATDADEGVNSALKYSIIGGNSQNLFSIDSLTGEVSLMKSLDYEAARSYRLSIRAIDSGNPSRSNNTVLLVNVGDVNDNPPKFYSPLFQETVQENLAIGSSVLRIQAFDPDDGNNAKIHYRISYKENPNLFPFEMESESGWIKTNRELDRESQNRYDFDVIAADSGESPLSATASVAIIIQDINDNTPSFEAKIYETAVSELDPPGTPVETVKATDPDENSRVTYEIADGNIRNRFSISTQNGAGLITIAQPLDFKLERKFVLTIKAIDSGGRFDLATINIKVQDANTFAPQFLNTPYSVKIFEDVPIGSIVLVVQAVDQDSGPNSQIMYSFIQDEDNEGNEAFMIDSITGAITTSQLLDREKVSGYILTVSARDKGIPPMSDTTDVEITINDINDNPPIFERDFYQAKVSEDVPIGTSILQVQAADADIHKNNIVRYSFSTFSDGDGTFSVDPASGIIRTIKSLDRETVSRYDLMVLATDQGSPEMTGRTNVTITILDVNDNSPHWESDRIRFFIPENSPLGSTVGTIQAYDPDEGSNAEILYSIVGGIDANSFTLNTHQKSSSGRGPGSADILTRIELDFESPRKKYDIIVRAASPPLRNDVHIEIFVSDKNDNPPQLRSQFQVILNNYKDHFPVGPIGRVPAFDADVTDQLQYSIRSGNKANLVYLNESTGLITLSPHLDTNVPLTAKMDVLVSDGLNEVSSEMFLQTRMITDDLLFNSVTIQIADMTTEAFLSPLYNHFLQALCVILNSPKENIVIFSVQEEIEGTHGVLNVSFSAKKPGSAASEEYFSPNYIKERVFLNRLTLSKLASMEILPFSDDLCLLEPCLNFEECLTILKFRNVSNFVATECMLFRSVYPWQTFACRCPKGFTGLKEHYLCDAEINLCFSSPCLNGGSCFRKERGYSCVCPPEFTGPSCEIQLELDTCQPNICSRGSVCTPRVRGGFLCQNCTRGDYVNQLCELTARSFSRGSFLTFPGLKNRYRLNIRMSFASQQRNGLLLYNGRYNERFDFIALEILNSTLRFSFSLGSTNNVTHVSTGKVVSDGLWHSVELSYFNKTATLSVDNCDVIINLEHTEEFPKDKSCAGNAWTELESRCNLLTESCQRFLDLTGPMYIGGLPAPTSSFQIETHDFLGCIKDVHIDHKFLDLNNYVMEYGTAQGCPEKKNFCLIKTCKNGGKCLDGWGTYRCQCLDGWGSKDCSEDAKPVWNLRDASSYLEFTPQLRPIQFPWFNSISLRSLHRSGNVMLIRLSNNETLQLRLDNGLFTFTLDGKDSPITVPRINDGYWHNIEIKWMTAEIWFSLDFGQHEITVPLEAKVQGLFVSHVVVGGLGDSFTGCVQDVRVGSSKNYHRKPTGEKFINEGCGLATACLNAVCPPRSTCIEEAGRHICKCDGGYVGEHCTPICDLRPCKNNGTCILDLTTSRGYKCKCDKYFRGNNCEEIMDLSCPSTWWGWPLCGPCSCPAERNFSPDCNKQTGQCKCKEYHYEKDNSCIDCMCYSVGSSSKSCDLHTGKCDCRPGVQGIRCDSCSNPFAEVTLRGCEVVYDGCPRSFHSDIWWSRSRFSTVSVHDCPARAIGLATRECNSPEGWALPDLFNCTSTSFISLLNIVAQLDSGELTLSPLLSIKLTADLYKALNVSSHLYGNDLWLSLRLLTNLIQHEIQQKGLNLSHRQDKNFINNLIMATGKVTSKEYAKEWQKVLRIHGSGSQTLMKQMDKYLSHLVVNQEDTFTKPIEIITSNLILGLDTVELTWDNEDKKNYENMAIQSSYDLYETTTIVKRAIRFPKYDNIIIDARRYSSKAKIIIPLEILGLNDEKDMAGNAVVGYMEYYSLWDVLPKMFQSDVNRRFNSEIVANPPIITLSILASRLGLQKGRQSSPIRISYEIYGKYVDSANPQCVLWEEPNVSGGITNGGWTTRPCTTQVDEVYVAKVGNMMTVNCTCWHLSTYALLIENNEINDVPRPGLLEDIITYVAFTLALILIFGALIALGLLKGPVPATITNTIHKHLLLSIFCSLLLYFVGLKLRLFLVQNDIPCRSVAIGLHFFWLSTFAWLFSSALHLRRMFTEVRDVNHGSALFYFALGYAFPLLCVALSLGVRAHHYGNKFFCWLFLYEGIVWGMMGPILLVVICTLATFLIAVRAAFALKDNVVDSGSMRTLLWMDLTLLPICGMVWALSLVGASERSPVWQYSISASVAILSLYIALGYCILNQRVKESLYIRAGNLFHRDDAQPSNISRSALAYRSDTGLRSDDLRREMFLGPRSMGISTASTTSRSTTKTSSSPYRSDGFHTYGGTPNIGEGGRFNKGNDTIDSIRKSYTKRGVKRGGGNSDEEQSSDGEHTLELASSHSSDDEDEAAGNGHAIRNATLVVNGYGNYRLIKGLVTPSPTRKHVSASLSTLNVPTAKLPQLPRLYSTNWTANISANATTYRDFTNNLRPQVGGRSSGSDNENPIINMSNAVAAPQEYVVPHKVLNENLHLGQASELKYGDKLPYMYQEPVNDLSGMLPQMSPPTGHSTPRPYQLSVGRSIDSPISPVPEGHDETGLEHEDFRGMGSPTMMHSMTSDGESSSAMQQTGENIYGGSITSGVLV